MTAAVGNRAILVASATNGVCEVQAGEESPNSTGQCAGQFPGGAPQPEPRQVFVFRFPSPNYGYTLLARPVQPEVTVGLVATYELGDAVRAINAAIELDIREAPLREWAIRVPADYSVVAVGGSEVADHVAEGAVENGARLLRIHFARAVEGRQLLQLRLEMTRSAAAGSVRAASSGAHASSPSSRGRRRPRTWPSASGRHGRWCCSASQHTPRPCGKWRSSITSSPCARPIWHRA